MKEKGGYVYIVTSGRNGTLYIGVTSDLAQRTWQHREGVIGGFTKEWKRLWKLRVIEEVNPDWDDLFESLF